MGDRINLALSIPAYAGEPDKLSQSLKEIWVDPRVRGGATRVAFAYLS